MRLDVVKEVGHGKDFLQHEHTFANFKKELTLWDKKKLAMQTTQSDNMVPEAKAIARDLIKNHVVPALFIRKLVSVPAKGMIPIESTLIHRHVSSHWK
jgi:hypothetical protein